MIDPDLLENVARLARLGLPPDEREALREQLQGILEHFRAIQEVDTSGVEPLAQVLLAHGTPLPDEPAPFEAPRERLLEGTGHAREGFIVVPRVLEDEEEG